MKNDIVYLQYENKGGGTRTLTHKHQSQILACLSNFTTPLMVLFITAWRMGNMSADHLVMATRTFL